MKYLALTLVTLTAAYSLHAQCDPTAIYANTSSNAVCTEVDGAVRYFYSNSLPNHTTGNFPNPGNPNSISSQSLERAMCAYPEESGSTIWLDEGSGSCPFWEFGIAVNGLIFDPIANEFFTTSTGMQNRDWNENALSPFVNLGTDTNDAHVQPTGQYHYHGDPRGMILEMGITPGVHSPIIGYAADGYPLYYKYVYSDPTDASSPITEINSCYQLKSGSRPGDGNSAPDGPYDGTYTQDYEYVGGSTCDLDECNGRFGVTPEYPAGTYYYVITEDFPVIPRCFKGNADKSFTVGPPPMGCATSNAGSICTLNTSVIDAADLIEAVNIYPNPATHWLYIELPADYVNEVAAVSILDMQGKLVKQLQSDFSAISVNGLAAGTYFLKLETGHGSSGKRFVVQ